MERKKKKVIPEHGKKKKSPFMWKIILTENPRCNVEPLKMDFVCKLYGNTYAVHVTVALVGVATLNLALPTPPCSNRTS